MPEAATSLPPKTRQRSHNRAGQLRPRLVSLDEAATYAGVGRSKFYDDFVDRVRTIKVGHRKLVDLDSLDALIDKLLEGER
jgi:hypothetical protein